jgi:hypothetical protein
VLVPAHNRFDTNDRASWLSAPYPCVWDLDYTDR